MLDEAMQVVANLRRRARLAHPLGVGESREATMDKVNLAQKTPAPRNRPTG